MSDSLPVPPAGPDTSPATGGEPPARRSAGSVSHTIIDAVMDGQPGRRHHPGDRGRPRARRPAHRVQRPGRAARMEPVLLRARQRDRAGMGRRRRRLLSDCSRARSSTRTPSRRPSTAGPSARSSIPLSQTGSQATPLILTGLSVAIAFRAGLFNIGAAGQWIGGAIVATYLGFAVSLPPVVHVIVCLLGGFAGGAVIGWLVGELKARTGAHEVIVTIMLNYIMYNLLSFLLSTTHRAPATRAVEPDQPEHRRQRRAAARRGPAPAGRRGLPGRPWPRPRPCGGCCPGRTIGFRFRTVGANPSAARSAGMNVERSWVLVMLIAGGLAGLAGAAVIQGPLQHLTFNSYGTYGFDGITVALLGRAKPGRRRAGRAAVRRAARGRHHDGGSDSGAVGHRRGAPGADRAVRRGPAAHPGDVPAPPGPGRRASRPCPKGWNA